MNLCQNPLKSCEPKCKSRLTAKTEVQGERGNFWGTALHTQVHEGLCTCILQLMIVWCVALQKRKLGGLALSEAEARAVQPVAQQRQATFGGTHPLTSGANHNYQVLGYTNTQRALFMKVSQWHVSHSSSCLMAAAMHCYHGCKLKKGDQSTARLSSQVSRTGCKIV